MDTINTVLGVPLGFIIYYAYQVTGSYGLAILIFAILVKFVLFPVMVLAHKNSIRLLQLQPSLHVIKRRYSGDKERISEEQYELFKKEKYSPLVGLVPLFVQLFLVMGMLQVMYHPLQHMLRLDQAAIDGLVQQTGFTNQLQILALVGGVDLHFMGLDLGIVPSFANPSPELVIIFLSGAVALAFCLVQNAISPGALSQSGRTNFGLTVFTVGLSLYFAAVLPVGVGLYWTVGNFTAIGVVLVLRGMYPPKKLAAEGVAYIQMTRKTPEQLQEDKRLKKELKQREKVDSDRFRTANKQLVFYAISGGQYKYYAEIIEYILKHSDLIIHYLTNDPDDALFTNPSERIIPYYSGHRKTIGLMMKLDADMVVTTVPDLQNHHIKRSIVRKDIEYVYVFHGFTSIHMVMRPGTLDHYDTVFCVGPHHVKEIRRSEELRKTNRKQLLKAGYGMFDRLIRQHENTLSHTNKTPQILIAPSWQNDNIMESHISPVLDQLLGQGYRIIVRPHPEYIKVFSEDIKKLQEMYADNIEKNELVFELDFKESTSMYLSDLVITDWSNAAYEFSFCTKRPAIFINTPMKVLNPNWQDFGIEPSDIYLRDQVGVSIDIADLDNLSDLVIRVLEREDYSKRISKTVDEFIFHPLRSGEAGGRYIIGRFKL